MGGLLFCVHDDRLWVSPQMSLPSRRILGLDLNKVHDPFFFLECLTFYVCMYARAFVSPTRGSTEMSLTVLDIESLRGIIRGGLLFCLFDN